MTFTPNRFPLGEPGQPNSQPNSWTGPSLSTIAVLAVTVVILYVGQEFLIPLALATLLSFMLSPPATRLRRWGLGRVTSVIIVVTLAVVTIGGLGLVVGSQVVELADNLPSYQQNIRAKIRSLQSTTPGGGVFGRAAETIREIGEEVSGEPETPAPQTEGGAELEEPITVRVEEPPLSPIQVIENIAGPLIAPVGTAGLVVVLVVFMLLERESLRDRLIKLVGSRDLHLTTEALGEAADRVSRYLLMQLIVNATYGLPIGIGLYLIGVPNALLWGVLATLLRFIPFLGPFIAALFPLALSIAVAPGWNMFLLTVALFVVVELFSNNVVEPWLYGSSTGMSSLVIILAAFFWTTLWGPVGLFLATPLTVCLVVMGRYIPQLRFLDVMLGSEPAMKPEERLYQRMLAGDPDEGAEMAEDFLRERPLAAFYDEVAIPALRLAERDRQRKALGGEALAIMSESFRTLVTELADHEDPPRPPEAEPPDTAGPNGKAAAQPVPPAAHPWIGPPVPCIGGRTALDTIAAEMLAQVLQRRGMGARILPAELLHAGNIDAIDLEGARLICLSYLGKAANVHARQVCRRLSRHAPGLKVLVGLWNQQLSGESDLDEAAESLSADAIALTLAEAVAHIERFAAEPIMAPMTAPPIPVGERERLAELKRLGALEAGPRDTLDHITRRLADAFDAPIALVSLIDESRQVWKSETGLPEDLARAGCTPRETSVCGHVVAANAPLVIEDVLRDERFANNPFLREHGIRFYAGVPLRSRSGHALGSLCVIDTKPRTVSGRERALLEIIAEEVIRELEAPHGRGASA